MHSFLANFIFKLYIACVQYLYFGHIYRFFQGLERMQPKNVITRPRPSVGPSFFRCRFCLVAIRSLTLPPVTAHFYESIFRTDSHPVRNRTSTKVKRLARLILQDSQGKYYHDAMRLMMILYNNLLNYYFSTVYGIGCLLCLHVFYVMCGLFFDIQCFSTFCGSLRVNVLTRKR